MRASLPLPLILIAALAFSGCKRPVLSNIASEIEGQWVPVSGFSNGDPAPASLFRMTFEFKGGRLLVNGGEPGSSYTIDATRNPAWLDIDNSLKQAGIIKLIDGQLYLTSTYVRPRPALAGISYVHRTSMSLDGWQAAVMVSGHPIDNGNGTETVKTRTAVQVGDQPKQFLKLEITRP